MFWFNAVQILTA